MQVPDLLSQRILMRLLSLKEALLMTQEVTQLLFPAQEVHSRRHTRNVRNTSTLSSPAFIPNRFSHQKNCCFIFYKNDSFIQRLAFGTIIIIKWVSTKFVPSTSSQGETLVSCFLSLSSLSSMDLDPVSRIHCLCVWLAIYLCSRGIYFSSSLPFSWFSRIVLW